MRPRTGPIFDRRLDYLDYVAAEPRPSISVIEDLDGEHVGYGAFWGEVQTNVHKALGVLGVVTNGSVRDIPMAAPGSQMLAGAIASSHVFVQLVEFGVVAAAPVRRLPIAGSRPLRPAGHAPLNFH